MNKNDANEMIALDSGTASLQFNAGNDVLSNEKGPLGNGAEAAIVDEKSSPTDSSTLRPPLTRNNTSSNATTTRKRLSLTFPAFRRSSTISTGHHNSSTTSNKRPISISAPVAVTHSPSAGNLNFPDLPSPLLSNSIYQNQAYISEQKRGSYSLCHSLAKSLEQAPTVVELGSHPLTLPVFVVRCCEFILANELLEGIFRVNSSLKKIKHLEALINTELVNHRDFRFEELAKADKELDDINTYDVAMVLKRFLNNSDDFIIGHESYNKFASNHEHVQDLISSPNSPLHTSSSDHSVPSASENSQFSDQSMITTSTTAEQQAEQQEQQEQPQQQSTFNSANINTSKTDSESKLDFQTASESINTNEKLSKSVETLLKLDAIDIVNHVSIPKLHLLIYLLNFLHKLTHLDSTVTQTKMSSMNLSKIFQPSIFEFKVEMHSSTENLLDFYKINELIFCRWIDHSEYLIDSIWSRVELKGKHVAEKEQPVKKVPEYRASSTLASTPAPELVAPVQPQPVLSPALNVQSAEQTLRQKPADEVKRSRRKSIFGYRSVSTPTPTPTLVHLDRSESTPQKSGLKRLPTTVFGSTYSLKNVNPQSPQEPTSESLQYNPIRSDKTNKKVKQRRRLTVYGFEHFRNRRPEQETSGKPEPSKEIEQTGQDEPINYLISHVGLDDDDKDLSFGLQKKPIYAYDMDFNSPRSSPMLNQSSTFGQDQMSVKSSSVASNNNTGKTNFWSLQKNYFKLFLQGTSTDSQ